MGRIRARSRIPDPLWAAAVKMVGMYGLHRTAKVLRVDYYSLKKRGEERAAINASLAAVPAGVAAAGATATFLELVPPADHSRPTPTMQADHCCAVVSGPVVARAVPPGVSDWTLELEKTGGAKQRVHLKGGAMPDRVALSRSFWNPGP